MRIYRDAEEHPKLKGFFKIPGFSGYVVSKNGLVKNITRPDKILEGYKKVRGYRSLSLIDDNGVKKGIGLHRLIAITFLVCPGDLSDYVPNHIDEDPENNCLDNIEWLTYKQNTQHSILKVRNRQKLPVSVRNVITGEEYQFDSLSSAAMKFNLRPSSLRSRVELYPDHVYDGFQFKYLNDKWITPRDINVRKMVFIKNMKSKEITCFEDQRTCADFLGISESTLSVYLINLDNRLLPGLYIAKRMGDDKWPKIDNPEKEFAKNGLRPAGSIGIAVTVSETGEEHYYTSLKSAAEANQLKTTTLHQRLKSDGNKTFKDGKRYAYL